MVSTETKNRFGYAILTVGMVIGLIAAFVNDKNIEEVNRKQTFFIIAQCDREKFRNKIALDFLERDKVRVEVDKRIDPAVRTAYISTIESQEKKLRNTPKCELP